MKEFLNTLLNSLNALEIHGKTNLEIMVGCIYAIEGKIAEIDADEQIPGEIIHEEVSEEDGR